MAVSGSGQPTCFTGFVSASAPVGEIPIFSTSNPLFFLMCWRLHSRLRILAHIAQNLLIPATGTLRQLRQSRFATVSEVLLFSGSSCDENCDPLKRANRSLHIFSHSMNCAGSGEASFLVFTCAYSFQFGVKQWTRSFPETRRCLCGISARIYRWACMLAGDRP
jgi:hypothetical protein